MHNNKQKELKILSFILAIILIFSLLPLNVYADSLLDSINSLSFYNFHYLSEDGDYVKTKTFYNWSEESANKNGIKIEKTGIDTIKLTVDATNEFYQTYKPVLIWIHKGDNISDYTRYTDEELWIKNKLETSYLLFKIPNNEENFEMEINVPTKMNTGQVGLLDGGFFETEFYAEGTIPEGLMFAYESQSYSIEELEEYINYNMEEDIKDYYNSDSGFRSEKDGFTFQNSDIPGGNGTCAGYAAITTAKYNGYDITTTFKNSDGENITVNPTYTWYNNIYGNASIRDIELEDEKFVLYNSPSKNMNNDGTAKYFERVFFDTESANDNTFFELLNYYLSMNNSAVLTKGNTTIGPARIQFLENRWSIIDYIASYLRQGKAITVNVGASGYGGHAIVGYKMEQIDEDTVRLYCYDNNFPDDMMPKYISSNIPAEERYDLNEDGSYKYIQWFKKDVYIDITKKTVVGKSGNFGQKEYEIFEFDATNTSVPATSENGTITFSIAKEDKVGIFNYGNDANEIVSYKAYPVIKDDKTVEIRTFAFYKSGEVSEITNSINTTIKMDYNYIGWYKIKDSKITLTKENYKLDNNGNSFIDCIVTYDNHTDSYGQLTVRIPVSN